MCSAPILGMDWGCGSIDLNMNEKHENATIHISPYQDAPFDLHVGFELKEMQTSGSNHAHPSRGFYCRRQERILKFLDALSLLTSQQLCDYVYTSILSRLRFVISHNRKDPSIERDLVQVRTLSLIAAGCGGRQLASIFRCLFFDYRHYSGGLPDLLLVRALYDDNGKQSTRLVDLKDWIGEKFLAGDANGTGMSNILIDKDDEFLGCNKVGDSGGRTNRSTGRMQTNREPKILSMDMLGEKLSLEHKEMKIFVQCMMVEVKSSNDRLDPRQEDWLNILAIHGNARVCKFQKGKTSNTK